MGSAGVSLLAVVFFALGVLTSSYSLPTLAKTYAFLQTLHPTASYLSYKSLQLLLSLFSFLVCSLLLTPSSSRKWLALVLFTQLCVFLHIILLGNWLIPGLSETERMEALMISHKGIGVAGGLMLLS